MKMQRPNPTSVEVSQPVMTQQGFEHTSMTSWRRPHAHCCVDKNGGAETIPWSEESLFTIVASKHNRSFNKYYVKMTHLHVTKFCKLCEVYTGQHTLWCRNSTADWDGSEWNGNKSLSTMKHCYREDEAQRIPCPIQLILPHGETNYTWERSAIYPVLPANCLFDPVIEDSIDEISMVGARL